MYYVIPLYRRPAPYNSLLFSDFRLHVDVLYYLLSVCTVILWLKVANIELDPRDITVLTLYTIICISNLSSDSDIIYMFTSIHIIITFLLLSSCT